MITGVIAEYNVFHNGHKYQIDEIKKTADAVVAVMSGSFVQRGDVAVSDKWTRAKTALIGGADLVIELPVCYAMSAAPNFASGGISVLNALGVIDSICFGSESGHIDDILKAAFILENETADISDKIKSYVSGGMGYPAALTKAYDGIIPREILSQPNNILAVEYTRALLRTKSRIRPITIKRRAAGHHDTVTNGNITSASHIRDMLFGGKDISSFIPYPVSEITSGAPFDISALDNAILARLRTMTASELRNISEVSEGLENRILECAKEADSFTSLVALIKNKRCTESKIRRILLAALIGYTKNIYSPEPQYIRVLGMNKTGMGILKQAKEKCSVPIITKTADFKGGSAQLALDIRATDTAMLCSRSDKRGGADFKRSPIVLA